MTNLVAYSNGRWIPDSELRVAVDDVGFLLGATVTERLRTFGGRVFRLDEHLQRMRHSLRIAGLDESVIATDVGQAIAEFVERNAGQIADDDDWTIIAFATPGVVGSGPPTVCVHGVPLQFHLWAEQYERGLPVVISRVRQVPPNCWPPELKCRSRMHYYLADLEAVQRRTGARAILLDQDGYVGETTSANVVVYRAGEGLVSPPPEHILYGVSLGVVEQLATQLGVPFVKRRMTDDELMAADELLLASTSICLLPVIECDGQPIGSGRPGEVFRQLLDAWNDLVGLDVAKQARRYARRG